MHDKLMGNARNLRKRMTPEERHLWYDFLKKLPMQKETEICQRRGSEYCGIPTRVFMKVFRLLQPIFWRN